jgi:hypothetical protein
VAPHDQTGFSLRWQFVPAYGKDRSVRWRWVAYTQSGHAFSASEADFETLTECMEDAKRHGYHSA